MVKVNENKHIIHAASDKHIKTYLNLMKMKKELNDADKDMIELAQKEHASRVLKNTLTSKNIKEDAPTNAMGSSSSTQGTGPITTFDPKLKKKKILKRFKEL